MLGKGAGSRSQHKEGHENQAQAAIDYAHHFTGLQRCDSFDSTCHEGQP
jgi:hypothetical protein